MEQDALVIGGGFYGLFLAECLARRGLRVRLCDRQPGPMQRASYVNQARVHNGYHYPRSILTAVRSRANFPRFVDEFRPAIDSSFQKIYAISQRLSKVSADQFVEAMQRIGAPIEEAPERIRTMFDAAYIEGVFLVREYAFDAVTLAAIMRQRVEAAGVALEWSCTAHQIRADGPTLTVTTTNGPRTARNVFCCTYAQLNALAAASGLPRVPLKHELTEMALIEVPEELKQLGITVMDGPFFSCMPFPPRGLHTLSHVRYTPHAHWYDGDGPYEPAYDVFDRMDKLTAYPHMIRDASRFLPCLARSLYRDSLWEVKTVMPRSETDDSRPILFKRDFGLPGLHFVMGGKIDNVYDVAEEVNAMLDDTRRPPRAEG